MPERLAAAKLRGFVDDYGGKVIASEPGLIRMRLGVPERHEGEAGRQRNLPLVSDGHHSTHDRS